jgi:hypothetical protein
MDHPAKRPERSRRPPKRRSVIPAQPGHHGWTTVAFLLLLMLVSGFGAFFAFRAATPGVPALSDPGALIFLTSGCSRASSSYRMSIDPAAISSHEATFHVNIDTDCGTIGERVWWALLLAGPVSRESMVTVQSTDAHLSNEIRPLSL